MADFSLLPLLAFRICLWKRTSKLLVLHVFELSIALPRIPKNTPQSHIALEKCHFMVQQEIVLGHIISKKGIEVYKAMVELIVKLPSPTTVKGDAKFVCDEKCQKSFEQLKQFLTTAPMVRALNWQLPLK
ncbi:hypothetical protein CK203_051457 [Vitis vinifera]|uniref:Uncharacterized protein n=1 Tax=Vitis vinifera TaxID=29760 RepID=A0A438H1D6_VITVI|nr:hypothetical protein CK203_051457 [Vitis vinifera]